MKDSDIIKQQRHSNHNCNGDSNFNGSRKSVKIETSRIEKLSSHFPTSQSDLSRTRRSSTSHSKYYYFLSDFWIRLFNFGLAFGTFNWGSGVSISVIRIVEVPDKHLVSRMILKLPVVCKYTVMQSWKLVYDNCLWLITMIMSSVQRKYVEEEGKEEARRDRDRRQEKGQTSERSSKTWRHYEQRRQGRLQKYIRTLKWTPIPIGVGFALLAYQHYRRVLRRNAGSGSDSKNAVAVQLAKDWEVTCYRMVPLRAFSRAWGWVHSVNLPLWARSPLYTWYAEAFQCNIFEAEIEDLRMYNNLGEFFRRGLKSGVRPICFQSPVVSVDGTVLHCGRVECGNVEQVKGVSYSLPTFLGPQTWTEQDNNNHSALDQLQPVDKQQYCGGLLKNKGTALYHCVIYLTPGDYHRFHSPVQWNVRFRRHFAGELLSVNPVVANWIAGLFSLNERAVYVGEWEHGFFSYTAVGATNVGSIKVYEDKDLTTNCRGIKKNTFVDKKFHKPLSLEKGSDFGEFNLGSTIVLLFEAPLDFEFAAQAGAKIRLGESLFKPASASASASSSSSSQADANANDDVTTAAKKTKSASASPSSSS